LPRASRRFDECGDPVINVVAHAPQERDGFAFLLLEPVNSRERVPSELLDLGVYIYSLSVDALGS
jgi:hypothetical protein